MWFRPGGYLGVIGRLGAELGDEPREILLEELHTGGLAGIDGGLGVCGGSHACLTDEAQLLLQKLPVGFFTQLDDSPCILTDGVQQGEGAEAVQDNLSIYLRNVFGAYVGETDPGDKANCGEAGGDAIFLQGDAQQVRDRSDASQDVDDVFHFVITSEMKFLYEYSRSWNFGSSAYALSVREITTYLYYYTTI